MKNNKIWIVGIVLIILGILGCIYYGLKEDDHKLYEETREIKKKYESLNGKVRETDKATYQNVYIDESIELDVVSAQTAVKFIKEESGVLFIGAPWCPWCRNALPVLMEAARDNNLVIKYLDITDIRNVYEIKDGKLVKTQKEGEGYYELLEALDSVLGDDTYKLEDDKGKVYNTKEKRIYMPSAIAVKNGKIVGTHVSTVNLNEGQTKYSKLEKEQVAELKSIYNDLIEKTKGLDVCSSETMCD